MLRRRAWRWPLRRRSSSSQSSSIASTATRRSRARSKSLTPGRQREYNLYFSDAKQPKTREARVERYAEKILDGKGVRDR